MVKMIFQNKIVTCNTKEDANALKKLGYKPVEYIEVTKGTGKDKETQKILKSELRLFKQDGWKTKEKKVDNG